MHEERGEDAAAVALLERLVEAEPAHEEGHAELMRLQARGGHRHRALRQYQHLKEALRRELDAAPAEATRRLYQEILASDFPSGRSFRGGTDGPSALRRHASDRSVDGAAPVEADAIAPATPPDDTVIGDVDHRAPGAKQAQGRDHPAAGETVSTAEPRRGRNPPCPLTSFIGRAGDVAEVVALLGATRLLTPTGAGGCGKTRLALEAARRLECAYPDGVWLADLALLADPALVTAAVAAALGVAEEPGHPLMDTLAAALHDAALLLVLDNCEHLAGACAALAERLLQSCPQLTILATSRAALTIGGEIAWRVLPLAALRPDRALTLDRLAEYDAVQLFLARARLVRPDFALTERTTPTVASVCWRLDGIPLAIELAAVRLRVLTVEDLSARLDDVVDLLAGGSRTALPRHRTLRATMEWSYALLSATERALLRRLAVFVGGRTLEASEAICNPDGTLDVLEGIASLIEKNLLRQEEGKGDEPRFVMLETLHEYARERLAQSGEEEALHRAHAAYFLGLAEAANPATMGADQVAWLARLEEEHDNLRAALHWAWEHDEDELALRLAGALWGFWYVRGHFSEGRAWLERLLARDGAHASAGVHIVEPAIWAKALRGAGSLAWCQGDYTRAADLLAHSVALYRDLDDREGLASSLNDLGVVAQDQSDYTRAAVLYEECVALNRELGHQQRLADALGNMGTMAHERGDNVRAAALLEESAALLRELGERHGIAVILSNLGILVSEQGDDERATALHEESLALFRDMDYKQGIAEALRCLGAIMNRRGDHERAAELYEESLALCRDLGDRRGIVLALNQIGDAARARKEFDRAATLYVESLAMLRDAADKPATAAGLERMAALACDGGQHERAARLWGAAAAIRQAIGVPVPSDERATHERDVAAARETLGDAAFAAAWAAGQALTLEQAIEAALAVS